MKRLEFKMMNPMDDMWIYFDGKPIKYKTSYGHRIYSYETQGDSVEIEIYHYNEVALKHYILFHIIFFLISILGIFNKRYDKRCISVKYKAILKLNEASNVVAKYNGNFNKEGAIELETDLEYEVLENTKEKDLNAIKRLKKLKLINFLIIILLIAILITAIVLSNQ